MSKGLCVGSNTMVVLLGTMCVRACVWTCVNLCLHGHVCSHTWVCSTCHGRVRLGT